MRTGDNSNGGVMPEPGAWNFRSIEERLAERCGAHGDVYSAAIAFARIASTMRASNGWSVRCSA